VRRAGRGGAGTGGQTGDERGSGGGCQGDVEGDFGRGGAVSNVPEEDLLSLQRQLADARENLRLIRERKAKYVFGVDAPLQLDKEERRWLDEIAVLEQLLLVNPPRTA
jgi:hypothetical protein